MDTGITQTKYTRFYNKPEPPSTPIVTINNVSLNNGKKITTFKTVKTIDENRWALFTVREN